MTIFRREKVTEIRDEVEPLFAMHAQEVGQHDLTFNVDWERVGQLEDQGSTVFITARLEDGTLIGYNGFILHRHLHYAEIVAINDILFVHPGHRYGSVGMRLIKHTESALAGLGAKKIYYHSKPNNVLGELLGRMGYEVMETIHAKRIGIGY